MKKKILSLILAVMFVFVCPVFSWAMISLGANDEIEISGKLQTRFTVNTADHRGYTYPQLSAGNLIQHRNIAYVEMKHRLTPDASYRLVGRALYEGIYDYGPDEYKDVRDANPDLIDDFKKDFDLWEGYVDITPGKFMFRVGKQIISWGETDLIPMLDKINPLDNTWGGFFEDLDDRRIPLWMLKAIYNFGDVGKIQSLALEGFINPAFADMEIAPSSPFGTPYAFPLPASSIEVRTIEPGNSMDDSRWGFRLQGVFADNYNWSLAHYRTYNDLPAARLVLDPDFVPVQELVYPLQTITGGSISFYSDLVQSVFRLEFAYHWDEPMFIPAQNLGVPSNIPEFDVLRFALAIDKNFWIRSLNRNSMFNFTLQYSGEYIKDYDDDIRMAALDYPSGDWAELKEYEQDIVFLCYTNYMSGKINPQIQGAWDPRGAILVMPQVTFIRDPWRMTVQYAFVDGKDDVSYGFYKDRDQFSLTFSFLF